MSEYKGLKGFALARESAFFKLEQEADIQRHRSRLVTQGRIEDIAGGYLMPKRQQTFAESAKSFEVLAEVLQQQVRLDDPTAAQRRKFLRKVKVTLPEITEAERRMYRSSLYGVARIGQIPRVSSLGRDKFVNHGGPANLPPVVHMSAAAKEAAQRVFSAGVRSLAYGTVLGGLAAVAVVGGAVGLYKASGVDVDSVRRGLQERGRQTGDSWRAWLPRQEAVLAISAQQGQAPTPGREEAYQIGREQNTSHGQEQ